MAGAAAARAAGLAAVAGAERAVALAAVTAAERAAGLVVAAAERGLAVERAATLAGAGAA